MEPQEKPLFTKILLVDDDEASAYLSSTILSDMHAAKDIDVARDGYSASGLLREDGNWPDIILLDINMPKMDGFEFLEHLKRIGASLRTKIIMLTTSSRKEDKEKAFSYRNVLDYVEKPLTEEIVRRIALAYGRFE
jgi:CheY-like chemotaxis protein